MQEVNKFPLVSVGETLINPGYVMISLALVADAVIGNVQEKSMRSYGASNSEVVIN